MAASSLLLVAVLSLCLLHLCSSCIEREKQALLTFKSSLLDPSNRLSSWVGQDCCEWDGVVCNNKTGHVVKLNLGNQNWTEDYRESWLVGSEVNPSLIELKHLEYLNLSGNNFTGSEIPIFIGNFSKLRHLDLSGANFGGAVPVSLGQLSKHLEYLDIGTNSFTRSEIPNFIGNFSKLRCLILSDASFGGAVPSSLWQLSKLEWLDLSRNSLTGVVSEIHFDKLSRLETLYLYHNSLVFNVSSNWTPSFQLKNIYLGSCLVGPRFPHWLQTQSRIEFLFLYNTSISDSIPNWFSNIASNFQYVDLSNNQIRGLVPDLSRNMTTSSSLFLYLNSNNFEGPLPPFPSNTYFMDLSNNFISGSLPPNISEMMPKLRFLLLSNNSISGSIPTSLCEISELQGINLSNNKFSGEIPQNCWSNLKHRECDLISLSLSNNNFYGELPSALRNCKKLVLLDISKNEFSGNIPSWI